MAWLHVFNKFAHGYHTVPLLCSDIDTKDNTAYGTARPGKSAQYEEIDISIEGVRTTSNKAYSVVQHSSPIEDAYESVTEAKTGKTALQDYEN